MSAPEASAHRSPAGRLIYAIGDVHGRADLLARLLAFVEAEAAASDCDPKVVFLGDIVDRGPDSQGALDLVGQALRRWPASRFCLGNHDQWLLRFLRADPAFAAVIDQWLEQGGAETLRSYGVAGGEPSDWRRRVLDAAPHHIALLEGASLFETDGEFLFVHAGIDPARPVEEQGDKEFLWIRAPFARHVGRLARIVVHGHTPQKPPRPHATENRVSLDTGAFFSNVLTMLRIDREAGTMRFLSPDRGGNVRPILPIALDRGLGTVLDDYG